MFLPQRCFQTNSNNNEPLRASGKAARASLPSPITGEYVCEGSFSLEAAIAVPLFIFFMMNLLFVFEAVRLQSGLQAALQQAGEKVCEAAYYTKFGGIQGAQQEEKAGTEAGGENRAASLILSETYVRNKVTSYLGDAFWTHSCVVGGRAGLSFAESRIMTEGGHVEIVVNCRVRPFVWIIAFPIFSMQARYSGHAWVGWTGGGGTTSAGGNGDDGGRVYVTRDGEGYHLDPACIFLNPRVRAVPASEVSKYRSADKSKYYPCECCKPGREGIVYITQDGLRYHSDRNCMAIVRHTSTMQENAAKEHYRPCPKCGKAH